MKYVRKIAVILLITLITICAVFISYTGIKNGAVVFATNQDGTLTNDELDVALHSWLESHGGNIFSPQNYRARKSYEAGLLHNFVYGNGGYDAIRNHINGGVGGNNELRFDFDGFIIQKLNTWLNQKLQDGEFGSGVSLDNNGMLDSQNTNTLYDGKYYDGSIMFITNRTGSISGPDNSAIEHKGSKFGYYGSQLTNGGSVTILGDTYSTRADVSSSSTYGTYYCNIIDTCNVSYCEKINNEKGTFYDGYTSILYERGYNMYWLITYVEYEGNSQNYNGTKIYYMQTLKYLGNSLNGSEDVDVNFEVNNNNNINIYPTVNNNTDVVYVTPKVNVGVDGQINYQPYIVNNNTTIENVINQYYIDSNDPDNTISVPSDTPSNPSGGGGGGNNDNPSGGTPPNWSNPYPSLNPDGNGGFNFNFTLPDLNIDWNISGLTEKFPFSIPFDFLAFCRVLNAEPQVPEWSGTLVLPMYSHQFTFSLQQFNSVAVILRNLEFIGFCIGLILATRSLIKG